MTYEYVTRLVAFDEMKETLNKFGAQGFKLVSTEKTSGDSWVIVMQRDVPPKPSVPPVH